MSLSSIWLEYLGRAFRELGQVVKLLSKRKWRLARLIFGDAIFPILHPVQYVQDERRCHEFEIEAREMVLGLFKS